MAQGRQADVEDQVKFALRVLLCDIPPVPIPELGVFFSFLEGRTRGDVYHAAPAALIVVVGVPEQQQAAVSRQRQIRRLPGDGGTVEGRDEREPGISFTGGKRPGATEPSYDRAVPVL